MTCIVLPPRRKFRSITISQVKPVADLNKELHDEGAPLRIEMAYRNHFPFNVHIVERSGLVTTLPARTLAGRSGAGVSIIKTYTVSGGVIIDATSLLHSSSATADLVALRDAMAMPRPRRYGTNDQYSVKYHLSQVEFEHMSGDVYVSELDLLITTKDPSLTSHPYSEASRNSLLANTSSSGAFIHYVVNDPDDEMPTSLYVNINGDVYRLDKDRDRLKSTGVYIYKHGLMGDPESVVTCEKISYTEAIAKYPLFPTYADAADHGSVSSRIDADADHIKNLTKLELLEKEAQVKISTLEGQSLISKLKVDTEERTAKIKERQSEQEEQLTVIDRANKELEHQHYLQKMEADRQSKMLEYQMKQFAAERDNQLAELKHSMASRSADRQDSSEVLKWLPAAMLGAAMIIPRLLG